MHLPLFLKRFSVTLKVEERLKVAYEVGEDDWVSFETS